MKRVIMGIIVLLAIGIGSEVVNAEASDSKEASSKITATINKGDTEDSSTEDSTDGSDETTTSSESTDSTESSSDSTENKKDKDGKDYLKTDSSSNGVITIAGISILGFIGGYFMGRRFTKGEK